HKTSQSSVLYSTENLSCEMSLRGELEGQEEEVTVFAGSSARDVSHARRLWSSVSLPPPLELRPAAAAHVRQRLPVFRPRSSGPAERPQSRRRQEEEVAVRRSQVLDLLRRQRELQLCRERRSTRGGADSMEEEEEKNEEKELVRQLQQR
uniref:Cilia- and flagella-associated protein HOATZ n=1 Tax=Oryzias latipes TaxID=8090 RepID=A0A3P9MIS6_ORYLA